MDFRGVRGACVVLDATEVHRDWFLAGLEFQLLRFLAREAGLRPLIPSSVVIEAIANHAREYSRAGKSFEKASRDLRRVGGFGMSPAPEFPDQLAYRELLEERLEYIGIEIADLPTTPHREIVERAVAGRPPFDENGSGYRDTLTWMTCVELAQQGREVFLVSQDKDFAGADLALATELADELADLPGSVTLVRHLGKWLTPLVPWSDVTDPREAAALARDEEVASFFAPWDMFEDPQFDAGELGLPPSAVIDDINYFGSGQLARISHNRDAAGSDHVVYEFPIDFEVQFKLPTEDAREAGFLNHEGSPLGVEVLSAVVPMTGVMTVIHNERDIEDPLYFESIYFKTPGVAYPPGPRPDDPEQLRLPLEPEEAS